MSLVTRILSNAADPIVAPDGSVKANTAITFQLVDTDKRQPVSLFDAAVDGGEYVTGTLVTATTDEIGEFSVPLWPNSRGEVATLYKVSLPGTTIKPFYIRVIEGAGDQTLIAARGAMEALQPQTLSLFEGLLANIITLVGTATALVTTTVNGLMAWQDKVKLDGIATNANNYTHPVNHDPAIISQDVDNRFVTDVEKAEWNAKAPASIVTTLVNGLMAFADKVKLNGIADNANNYSHPANHDPAIITQDANNRFVTDVEKATWDANSYTHPVNHDPAIITQDANNRFVTDAEKTAWNAKAPTDSPTFTGPVGGITKAMVGLPNADDTSDAAKPISTATATALGLKAPIASPVFTTQATAPKFVSTAPQGTAPLTAISTTKVTNLNADMVEGFHASQTPAANEIVVVDGGGSTAVPGPMSATRFVSTAPQGTAPLTAISTTKVTNLNADMVEGFHASQTPAAGEIVAVKADGSTVLPGPVAAKNLALYAAQAAPTYLSFGNNGATHYIGVNATDATGFGGMGGANALVLEASGLNSIAFGNNGVERARINTLGNLLVNTPTDNGSGAKLQVAGGITATTTITAAGGLITCVYTPASGEGGVVGVITRDDNYLYVCVAVSGANSWKRTALTNY